jgi:hypothetical protein
MLSLPSFSSKPAGVGGMHVASMSSILDKPSGMFWLAGLTSTWYFAGLSGLPVELWELTILL